MSVCHSLAAAVRALPELSVSMTLRKPLSGDLLGEPAQPQCKADQNSMLLTRYDEVKTATA